MFKLMLLNVEAGAAAGYLMVVFYSSRLLGSLSVSLDLTLPPNRHAFSVYAFSFRREACAYRCLQANTPDWWQVWLLRAHKCRLLGFHANSIEEHKDKNTKSLLVCPTLYSVARLKLTWVIFPYALDVFWVLDFVAAGFLGCG